MLSGTEFLQNRTGKINLDSKITSIKKFGKMGNQGIIELVEIDGKKSITKVSQYIDFTIRHEYNAMKGFDGFSQYCPHFCRAYGLKEMNIGKMYENKSSIFYTPSTDDERINMDILFMEYIPSSMSLALGILEQVISHRQLFSCLKQVLVGLKIAQLKLKFTHYDLHTDNILLLPIQKNSFSLYVLDKEKFLIPTHGVLPVIIDFGFSYSDSLKGTNFYSTIDHTNRGYCPFVFDSFNDIKILMLNVLQDNQRVENPYDLKEFKRYIFKIFGKLTIDIESGWDDLEGPSLNGILSDSVHSISKKQIKVKKHPFIQFPNFCIDMMAALITLPFKENKNVKSTIKTAFTMFLTEFEKIPATKKYKTLKTIIDVASKYKQDYENNVPGSLTKFQNDLEVSLGKLGGISFEKLLCSLVSLSKRMENSIIENSQKLVTFKEEQKQILNSQKVFDVLDLFYTIEDIYNPDKFTFENDSCVYIWNSITKTNNCISLTPQDVTQLNFLVSTKAQTDYLFKQYVS